jgi:hypothetical protein
VRAGALLRLRGVKDFSVSPEATDAIKQPAERPARGAKPRAAGIEHSANYTAASAAHSARERTAYNSLALCSSARSDVAHTLGIKCGVIVVFLVGFGG